MAEKKVSIRLVVRDGKVVASELEGLGQKGEAAFGKIDRASLGASLSLRRLAGIAAGALSLRQVVAYADQWTDLRSRVDLATGSQEAGAAVMDRLADMARRTYSSLGQTAESWLSMSTSLRELGMSTSESLDFTEALNNAMVVSGAKAERAASVQYALSKAMAMGVLRGDELNRVIEAGGRVAELLAAEMGVTVTELRRLGPQGKITGDVIRRALVGNLELLRAEADSMPATIGDAFTLIGNAALRLVGTWDQMTGSSAMVAQALIAVADNLERLAAIGIAFVTFMGARWVAAFVAVRVATLTLSGALVILRGAIVRTGIGALIVGAGELIYWFGQLVKGAGGLSAALGLLKNLALEVWERIKLGASAMVEGIGGAWQAMKAEFFWNLHDMLAGFDRFIGGVARALNETFKTNLATSPLAGMLADLNAAGNDAMILSNTMTRAGAAAEAAAKAPLASLQALKDAMTGAGKDGADALDNAAAAAANLDDQLEKGGGAKKLKDDLKDAESFASRVAQTVKGAFGSLFDSIFEGGKKAGEVLADLGKKLASMALQEAFFKMLAAAFPKTFGGGGFIPLVKSAQGNVFQGGNVIPFAAGGVVTRATTFPLKGATGLMGEAGPEAILPLTRIGGRLGVAAAGGGGTVVQIVDQRRGGADIETRRERGPDGREMVTMVVRDEMARGAFDRSMNGRYGAQPRAVQR